MKTDKEQSNIIDQPNDISSMDEGTNVEDVNAQINATDESNDARQNRKAEIALHDLTDINSENVKRGVSLMGILGGDILAGPWFRKYFWYMVVVVILTVLYVSNRYQSQKELIEIDKLQKELLDVRYNELTRSSELQERTRRSKVEEFLKETNDSTLQTATTSPYVLKLDD